MMKKRHCTYILAAIFILALALRLFLAFQTPAFEIDNAYFTYRQVESIKESGLPTYFDDLSYSGRTRVFPPVYYYILSAFSFIFGTAMTLKILPNIFVCALIVIIYYIVLEMTNNRSISLFCAFTSAFIPVFFAETINSASIFSFTLPLTFYVLYCFMRIKKRKFLHHLLIFSFILSLTSAISFLFVFALLIYLLLAKLEYKLQNRLELESILFVIFLMLWVNVLIYKKAFLFHSYALIWQNIPLQVLASYFKQVDVVASVTSIGLVPLVLGTYAIYRYMLKERDKSTYLLMAFALAVAFLLWFKLLTLDVGLMFLGAILIPLLGQTLNLMFKYVEMTKVSSYKLLFWIPLFALVVFTAVMPSVAKASVSIGDSLSQEEDDALAWLRENTEEGSVVLSTIAEGNLITSLAGRKNVADSDFILIRSPGDIFDDVNSMYTTILKTNAVELMNKYDVDYVYFSPRAKKEFSIDGLKFAEEDCFELVYDRQVQIYRSLCEVRA